MKFPLDDRPMLKMTIDAIMMVTAFLSVVNKNSKDAEQAARAEIIVAERRYDGAHRYAQGLEGQLEEAKTKAANYAEKGKEMAGTIRTLNAQLGEQGKQIGELNTAMNRLRPGGPCDAVFLIDATGSTAPFHDHVKNSLKALFRWAPRLSSELRIGVIPFRDGPLDEYPLAVIKPRYEDKGKSQDSLLAFVDGLVTKTSNTNHRPVFEKAFDMLGPSLKENRRAVAILVGDIGPSELDNYAGYSDAERREAQRIMTGVRRWTSTGMRTVSAIYLGTSGASSEHYRWFKSLSCPDPSHFASDSSQMFNVILTTIEK